MEGLSGTTPAAAPDSVAGTANDDGSAEDIEARLLARLVAAGRLDTAGVERARRVGSEAGVRIPEILVKLGLVSEADLAAAFALVTDLPLATARDYPAVPVLDGRITPNFLRAARILPLAETDRAVELAMVDPTDAFAVRSVALAAGKPVLKRVAIASDVERAFERLYGKGGSAIGAIVDGLGSDEGERADEDAERLKDLASEAPVIRLVHLLITRAVEARASDIHIEPFENLLRVRYRIDGVLHEVESPPVKLRAAIVSRVKIMAKLNIAERRLPQDGRIKLAIRGKEIDFRVSTLPTMHGESVVLRILDKGGASFDFAALGLEADTLARYLRVLERPNGIVLVTGPTGSGKTTTLYTSLVRLNTPDKKIVTVEDPVEYQLAGVNQIQVKPQIGLSFANVLRSILRQDPDIIMIGEIRDVETARIAAQAALTGHLVLSTLHTNSAAASVTRLLDMGLEDYLLAATLSGVAAQRLVRALCRHCRAPHPASAAMVAQLGLARFAEDQPGGDGPGGDRTGGDGPGGDGPTIVFRPVGCAHCGGTGYFGRTGIAEMLIVSDELRPLLLRRADAREIHRAALAQGMRSLFEDGLGKVARGVTSIDEVLRVTGDG